MTLRKMERELERTVKFFKNTLGISNSRDSNLEPENSNISQGFQRSIHIFSHLDSDGLSSATILIQALKREKIGYQLTIINQLEISHILSINQKIKEYNQFIIFADFGSSQYDLIKQNLKKTDYLILDHHKPHIIEDIGKYKDTINHINPYFFGIDGSIEMSGSGVAYLFSKALNQENRDLSMLGIIGAYGDMQNQGPKGQFLGANKEILNDAKELGLIKEEINIAISRNQPITFALAFTLRESIPGLTGDTVASTNFLENNNIRTITELNEPRSLINLSEREKKSLNKALIQYAVVEKGMAPTLMQKLITTFYLLPQMNLNKHIMDIQEISQLFNACGRTGNPSLGISAILGDKNAYNKGKDILQGYQDHIAKKRNWAKNNVEEKDVMFILNGEGNIQEKIIGTIAGQLLQEKKFQEKPIFAYTSSKDNYFKISTRTTPKIVQKGVDLALILKNVSEKLSIETPAGGHPPAAGAIILKEKMPEFIKLFQKNLKDYS